MLVHTIFKHYMALKQVYKCLELCLPSTNDSVHGDFVVGQESQNRFHCTIGNLQDGNVRRIHRVCSSRRRRVYATKIVGRFAPIASEA